MLVQPNSKLVPLIISVITATRNNADTLEDTILSVAGQNYPNVEHIIVDGASTDDTQAIIERNKLRIALTVSEPDRGVYDAMNKGISLATGAIVGFLNSDDVYTDSTVLSQVASIFQNDRVDACYGDLVYVDKTDLNRVIRYWKSQPYREGLFKKGWMPAHPTFFVRREVYKKFGGFDLEFKLQSDFELTMRLLAVHKIRTAYIPRTLVKMRMGGMSNSKISNMVKGNFEAYRACRKNNISVSPIFMIRKILSRIPQFISQPKD